MKIIRLVVTAAFVQAEMVHELIGHGSSYFSTLIMRKSVDPVSSNCMRQSSSCAPLGYLAVWRFSHGSSWIVRFKQHGLCEGLERQANSHVVTRICIFKQQPGRC